MKQNRLGKILTCTALLSASVSSSAFAQFSSKKSKELQGHYYGADVTILEIGDIVETNLKNVSSDAHHYIAGQIYVPEQLENTKGELVCSLRLPGDAISQQGQKRLFSDNYKLKKTYSLSEMIIQLGESAHEAVAWKKVAGERQYEGFVRGTTDFDEALKNGLADDAGWLNRAPGEDVFKHRECDCDNDTTQGLSEATRAKYQKVVLVLSEGDSSGRDLIISCELESDREQELVTLREMTNTVGNKNGLSFYTEVEE